MEQTTTKVKRFETCALCNEPYGLDCNTGYCSNCKGSPLAIRESDSAANSLPVKKKTTTQKILYCLEALLASLLSIIGFLCGAFLVLAALGDGHGGNNDAGANHIILGLLMC